MKKITAFLEQHCQWVAIAAGAAYLLWMVYAFVLTNTEWQIKVGSESVSPGEVDETVAKIADQLDNKIKNGPKITISVPNFESAIDVNAKKMPEYASAWANSPTHDVSIPVAPDQNNPQNPPKGGGPGAIAGAKVIELPKVPAPTELATSSGRSNLLVPPQVAVAALPNPNNPNPAPAAAPVEQAATPTDTGWVTVAFKISLADLAKEYQRTNIPQQAQFTTEFLTVELVREEMMADGTWGNQTICPKLTTSTQPPFPGANAGKQAQTAYATWAGTALPEILQPKFYDVVKGDLWTLSKDYVGTGAVSETGPPLILGPKDLRPGFDPNQFVGMDPKQRPAAMAAMNPPLTNAEKQAIQKAINEDNAKKAAEKARSRPQPAPRGGSPRGGAGGRPGDLALAPEDSSRPPVRNFAPGNEIPGPGVMPGLPPAPSNPTAQQPANYSNLFPLPTPAEFDPRTLTAAGAPGAAPGQPNTTTIVGWVHDAQPEPGKTYHYKVRYKIKNPIWGTINVANPKALAEKFAIDSAESAWTEAVKVPEIVSFWFASAGGLNRVEGNVDVYRWVNGSNHKARFKILPGDSVGRESDGIDFGTGYTLVELRQEGKGGYVAWLLKPDGAMVKRNVKADQDSPEHKKMDSSVPAAAAGAAASAAAVGGAPAMINPGK